MMNILITTKTVDDNLINILNIIDYKKVNVELLLMNNIVLIGIPKEVHITYYKDYLLKPNKILYNLKKMIFVNDLYNKFRFAFKKSYDVSVAYDGSDNYIDMVAASVNSKKKVIWVHNDIKSNRNIYKMMSKKYEYFDKIVCISSGIKDNFDKLFNYKDKTVVINNLIDGDHIIKLAKEKTPIKLGKGYNIVGIGNINSDNNFDKLVELHYTLLNNGYHVNTYIIGDGNETYNISNQIRKLNITDSFILLGDLVNPYNILNKADLFISLSNKYTNDLLNSNILDKPFIALNNIEITDIINVIPKNGGIICNSNNLYKEVAKQIHVWQKHISFNYKQYEKAVMKDIGNLLEVGEK